MIKFQIKRSIKNEIKIYALLFIRFFHRKYYF